MYATDGTGECASWSWCKEFDHVIWTEDPSSVPIRVILVVGGNNDDPSAAFQEVRRSIIVALATPQDTPLRFKTEGSRAPRTPSESRDGMTGWLSLFSSLFSVYGLTAEFTPHSPGLSLIYSGYLIYAALGVMRTALWTLSPFHRQIGTCGARLPS